MFSASLLGGLGKRGLLMVHTKWAGSRSVSIAAVSWRPRRGPSSGHSKQSSSSSLCPRFKQHSGGLQEVGSVQMFVACTTAHKSALQQYWADVIGMFSPRGRKAPSLISPATPLIRRVLLLSSSCSFGFVTMCVCLKSKHDSAFCRPSNL